jgi:hypothetical protein
MRTYIPVFIFFISLNTLGALSPRMYSIILQGGFTSHQTSDSANNSGYSNKADINLLFFERSGLTLGAHYLQESLYETEREFGEAYGFTVGYFWNRGWFIIGNYDFTAKLGNWHTGHAAQGNVGYLEHIGSHFHVGLQMSYRAATYTENELIPNTPYRTEHNTYPSLTLMYLF